ncbi:histone-lysine N-methyltransferase SETD1A-like isoform X1 [Thrips palmi]|uniref:Histone-lysine N-methyltransferase SETD1A-like isoform X1 n=1 Tax=Thrips palmi TaxID=161013 RepID=A0A6P8Z4S8_THRPL|nr:histone-lysine N-methyltransferase SETD1A-like isoform X1 [Thrips palmi]
MIKDKTANNKNKINSICKLSCAYFLCAISVSFLFSMSCFNACHAARLVFQCFADEVVVCACLRYLTRDTSTSSSSSSDSSSSSNSSSTSSTSSSSSSSTSSSSRESSPAPPPKAARKSRSRVKRRSDAPLTKPTGSTPPEKSASDGVPVEKPTESRPPSPEAPPEKSASDGVPVEKPTESRPPSPEAPPEDTQKSAPDSVPVGEPTGSLPASPAALPEEVIDEPLDLSSRESVEPAPLRRESTPSPPVPLDLSPKKRRVSTDAVPARTRRVLPAPNRRALTRAASADERRPGSWGLLRTPPRSSRDERHF